MFHNNNYIVLVYFSDESEDEKDKGASEDEDKVKPENDEGKDIHSFISSFHLFIRSFCISY
jgi:hypothetical protein